jgi:hypothetical protein
LKNLGEFFGKPGWRPGIAWKKQGAWQRPEGKDIYRRRHLDPGKFSVLVKNSVAF